MTDEKAARLAAIRAAKASQYVETPAPVAESRPQTQKPSTPAPLSDSWDDPEAAIGLSTTLLIMLAAILGAFAAVVVLPNWLPGLSASLLSTEPKAYWYLSRSSALVAYLLLWLSMVFGLLMTNKLARAWPGGPAAFDLHQHTSLLGLAFALFHALILMGDRYIQASLSQVLVPFTYNGYQPLWVGVGQIGLYLLALVSLSFSAKPWIGRNGWRMIHFLSFVLFGLALLHGIMSGSDSAQPWVQFMYWFTGGSTVFLVCYRILTRQQPGAAKPQIA